MKPLTGFFFVPVALTIASNFNTHTLVQERDNYPIDDHKVQTSDGYILTMFRMNRPIPSNKPVVFLLHGIFCSSDHFVVNGAGRALAHILVDEGFDVWLGNARGNKYSKNHATYSNLDPRFWSFEWHDIGLKDLPAMIDYILKETGSEKLHYVGHSQGATTFLVLNSMQPDYGQKTIKSAHLLAPACFLGNIRSEFRALAPIIGAPQFPGHSLRTEVLPDSPILKLICSGRNYERCKSFFNFFGGFDHKLVNRVGIFLRMFSKLISINSNHRQLWMTFFQHQLPDHHGSKYSISFKQ